MDEYRHKPPDALLRRPLVSSKVRHYYSLYMGAVALLGCMFIYLQAALITKNESSENVSMPAFLIVALVMVSLCIYGLITNEKVFIIVGIIGAIGAGWAIGATYHYRPLYNAGAFARTF